MKKTATQAAIDIWKESGLSQKKLADKMELKSQQAAHCMLNAKNGMRTDNFIKMMNVLGYDVVLRNKVNDNEIELITEVGETE